MFKIKTLLFLAVAVSTCAQEAPQYATPEQSLRNNLKRVAITPATLGSVIIQRGTNMLLQESFYSASTNERPGDVILVKGTWDNGTNKIWLTNNVAVRGEGVGALKFTAPGDTLGLSSVMMTVGTNVTFEDLTLTCVVTNPSDTTLQGLLGSGLNQHGYTNLIINRVKFFGDCALLVNQSSNKVTADIRDSSFTGARCFTTGMGVNSANSVEGSNSVHRFWNCDFDATPLSQAAAAVSRVCVIAGIKAGRAEFNDCRFRYGDLFNTTASIVVENKTSQSTNFNPMSWVFTNCTIEAVGVSVAGSADFDVQANNLMIWDNPLKKDGLKFTHVQATSHIMTYNKEVRAPDTQFPYFDISSVTSSNAGSATAGNKTWTNRGDGVFFQVGSAVRWLMYTNGYWKMYLASGATEAYTNNTLLGLWQVSAGAAPAPIMTVPINPTFHHLVSITNYGLPTIAAGAGAGTSPTVSIAGTDTAGKVTITTGTAVPTASLVATITFNTCYANDKAPIVMLTPGNALTANLAFDVVPGSTATTWTMTTPTGVGLADSSTYLWNYIIIQ